MPENHHQEPEEEIHAMDTLVGLHDPSRVQQAEKWHPPALPKDVPVLILGICEYVTLHNKRDSVAMIN